jgi:hypothetical protein
MLIANSYDDFWPGGEAKGVTTLSYPEAGFAAVAFEAYLRGRFPQSALWPLFKSHNIADPSDWLRLFSRGRRTIEAVVSPRRMWEPIYRWQGEGGFLVGEQWSNCVGIADTRRLVALIMRAWSEMGSRRYSRTPG